MQKEAWLSPWGYFLLLGFAGVMKCAMGVLWRRVKPKQATGLPPTVAVNKNFCSSQVTVTSSGIDNTTGTVLQQTLTVHPCTEDQGQWSHTLLC